jgi:Rps23 Pro-64 3,4-dihydroxylase Tpa1-like proline 4-hydroxylase
MLPEFLAENSKELLINRSFWGNRDGARAGLQQPFMYVEQALEEKFAERLYDELASFTGWRDESYKTDNYGKTTGGLRDFKYHRKQIDMDALNSPPSLRALYRFLNSRECLEWMSDVSGRRCDAFGGGAAVYDIGDSLDEHNDQLTFKDEDGNIITRAVTFNYFLTRDWSKEWGGRFIWCKPRQEFVPTFNTLLLFRVGAETLHKVEPILAGARQRRYSITGWFVTKRSPVELEKLKLNLKI